MEIRKEIAKTLLKAVAGGAVVGGIALACGATLGVAAIAAGVAALAIIAFKVVSHLYDNSRWGTRQDWSAYQKPTSADNSTVVANRIMTPALIRQEQQ